VYFHWTTGVAPRPGVVIETSRPRLTRCEVLAARAKSAPAPCG
jgi:hypothetical protein